MTVHANTKKYKINEIFYSIQGEGYHAGMPFVFVRFSGCNEACSFCDTQHQKYTEMTANEIYQEVQKHGCYNVCFTGGEPFLQLDTEILWLFNPDQETYDDGYYTDGYIYYVTVETNGTIDPKDLSYSIDWITVSPKSIINIPKANEMKILVGGNDTNESILKTSKLLKCENLYLQPISNKPENIQKCIDLIKQSHMFRLSLQIHKIIGVK